MSHSSGIAWPCDLDVQADLENKSIKHSWKTRWVVFSLFRHARMWTRNRRKLNEKNTPTCCRKERKRLKMFSWCRAWIAKWFCFSIVAPKIKSKCWIHVADKDGFSDHDIWYWFTHCSIKRLDSCFIFCSNKTCFFHPFLIRGHFWCWVRRHCQSKFCKTWQSHCLLKNRNKHDTKKPTRGRPQPLNRPAENSNTRSWALHTQNYRPRFHRIPSFFYLRLLLISQDTGSPCAESKQCVRATTLIANSKRGGLARWLF